MLFLSLDLKNQYYEKVFMTENVKSYVISMDFYTMSVHISRQYPLIDIFELCIFCL